MIEFHIPPTQQKTFALLWLADGRGTAERKASYLRHKPRFLDSVRPPQNAALAYHNGR